KMGTLPKHLPRRADAKTFRRYLPSGRSGRALVWLLPHSIPDVLRQIFDSSLFGSIANTSLMNVPFQSEWMLQPLSHAPSLVRRNQWQSDSCLVADCRRRISFPDMDGCVAAIWAPMAESLF